MAKLKPAADTHINNETENLDADPSAKARGPSRLALEIASLKKATVNAAAKREHLPQPLFWSLFASRLKEIKKAKEEKELVKIIFDL